MSDLTDIEHKITSISSNRDTAYRPSGRTNCETGCNHCPWSTAGRPSHGVQSLLACRGISHAVSRRLPFGATSHESPPCRYFRKKIHTQYLRSTIRVGCPQVGVQLPCACILSIGLPRLWSSFPPFAPVLSHRRFSLLPLFYPSLIVRQRRLFSSSLPFLSMDRTLYDRSPREILLPPPAQ